MNPTAIPTMHPAVPARSLTHGSSGSRIHTCLLSPPNPARSPRLFFSFLFTKDPADSRTRILTCLLPPPNPARSPSCSDSSFGHHDNQDPADNRTYAYADVVNWTDPFYPVSYR